MKSKAIFVESSLGCDVRAAAEAIAEYLGKQGEKVKLCAEYPLCDAGSTDGEGADLDAVCVFAGRLLRKPTTDVADISGDEQALQHYVENTLGAVKRSEPSVIYVTAADKETASAADDRANADTQPQFDGEDLRAERERDLRILKNAGAKLQVTESVDEQTLSLLFDEAAHKRALAKKELWRALKYTLFAISAGAIQLISSAILKLVLDAVIVEKIPFQFIIEQDVSTFVADTVGLALSIIWNFTFNRKFTFKAANNVPVAMLLAFLFYVPFYPFQIWYIPMVEQGLNIGFWGWMIGLVTCMLINFVLEFLWQQFVVFRGKLDTNSLAKKDAQATSQTAADGAEEEKETAVSDEENKKQ